MSSDPAGVEQLTRSAVTSWTTDDLEECRELIRRSKKRRDLDGQGWFTVADQAARDLETIEDVAMSEFGRAQSGPEFDAEADEPRPAKRMKRANWLVEVARADDEIHNEIIIS